MNFLAKLGANATLSYKYRLRAKKNRKWKSAFLDTMFYSTLHVYSYFITLSFIQFVVALIKHGFFSLDFRVAALPSNLTPSAQFQLMYQQQQQNIRNRLNDSRVPMQISSISNNALKLHVSLPPGMSLADGDVNSYIREQARLMLEQQNRTLQLASFGSSNQRPAAYALNVQMPGGVAPVQRPNIRYVSRLPVSYQAPVNYQNVNIISQVRPVVSNIHPSIRNVRPGVNNVGAVATNTQETASNGQKRGRPSRYDI